MKGRLVGAAAMAGLGLAISSSAAMASGFAIRENSAEGVATVFAGAGSRADDLSTVFDNPAGMTRLSGTQAEFGSAIVFPSINFHGTDTGGGSEANGGRTALIPNLYGVTDITPDLKAGLAVTAPFGNTVQYNTGWAGRYLGVKSAIMSVDVNPNLAYRINDKLSVGGGISAQYFSVDLSNAINQGLVGAPDGLSRFKASDWGVGYNLGVLFEPIQGTRLGVTYRSKISHQVSGDLHFSGVSPLVALGPPFSTGLADGPATADINVPATTGVSITHDLSPQWSVSSDVQWTQWSTFQQASVVRSSGAVASSTIEGYRDTWFVSASVSYKPSDRWTLRSGIGWDQSPVTNYYRTVRLPDNDRYMVGLGFSYQISDRLSLDAAYAHYFAANATMNQSINRTDASTGVSTTLTGNYELSLDYLAASLRLKF